MAARPVGTSGGNGHLGPVTLIPHHGGWLFNPGKGVEMSGPVLKE
jgi:hypothetical protein